MKRSIKRVLLIIVVIVCLCSTLIGCTREKAGVTSSFTTAFSDSSSFSSWGLYCDYRFLNGKEKKIDNASIQLYFGLGDTWKISEQQDVGIKENINTCNTEKVPFVTIGIFFRYCETENIYDLIRIDGAGEYYDEEYRTILTDDYKNNENAILMKEYTREEFNSEEYVCKFKRALLGTKIEYSHYETFTVPPSLLSHGNGYIAVSVQAIYRTSDGKYITHGQGRRIFKYSAIDDATVTISNVSDLWGEKDNLK